MAGQITQWMKDGGFDSDEFMRKFYQSPGAKSPLEHIIRALQPAVDTVVGGGKVLRDGARVAAGPTVDAVRRGLYGAAGLQANDPTAYSDSANADFARSTGELARPTRNGLESIQNLIRSHLKDGGTPAAAPGMTAADMRAVYDQAPGPSAAPRAIAPSAPVRRTGALTNSPAQPGATVIPEEQAAGGALPQAPIQQAAPQAQEATAPGPQEKTLAQMFKERMDQIPQVDMNKLDGDQKHQLALQFFMNLMARGGEANGKSVLGNVGDSGIDTLKTFRNIQNQNNQNMIGQRTRESENAFRELQLADRDQDNKTQSRRFDIMEKRFSEGKWSLQETENGHVLMDDKGNVKPVPGDIKLKSKDTRHATIELLDHFRKNPKDLALMDRINASKKTGSGDDSDAVSEKDRVKMILEHYKGRSEFEGGTMKDSERAIDILLGRAKDHPPRPTGAAAIQHLTPEKQAKAMKIKSLLGSGKLTKEAALQELKALELE